jgi:hypothetical protein
MGSACGPDESNKECMHNLDRENSIESSHLEDGERDESVTDSRSKLLRCSVNRIELAQDRPMSMSVTIVNVKRINGQCDEESWETVIC